MAVEPEPAQPLKLNLVKSIREPLPILGDNTTLGNMDGVTDYSYTGLGNGVVVMI